jgi:hypothetical protein
MTVVRRKPVTPMSEAGPSTELAWLLAQLDAPSLTELERAVSLTLNPVKTPVEERAQELGALARIVNALPPNPGLAFPLISRKEYDAARPADSPSSTTLARRYGSWHAVCSRAYQVDPNEGTYDRTNRSWRLNQPWPNPSRGTRAPQPYTLAEVLDAICACAEALGRPPTLLRYRFWTRQQQRRARRLGHEPRIPGQTVIYRFFPSSEGGFRAARDAALEPRST